MHMLGEKWPVLKVEKLMQLRSYVFAEDIKQKKKTHVKNPWHEYLKSVLPCQSKLEQDK